MNNLPLILLALLIPCLTNSQQLCDCNASTLKEKQRRSNVKHISNYSSIAKRSSLLTIEEMYTWDSKYAGKTAHVSVQPTSARLHNTPEDTMYTIKCYLWFVKVEENDCDMHMEIGTSNIADTRMVVEVPKENAALQTRIKQKLDELGLKIMNCGTKNKKKAHFTKGVPVQVTGIGFYDASHKANTNHGDSCTKKYVWELHPVTEVVFL